MDCPVEDGKKAVCLKTVYSESDLNPGDINKGCFALPADETIKMECTMAGKTETCMCEADLCNSSDSLHQRMTSALITVSLGYYFATKVLA